MYILVPMYILIGRNDQQVSAQLVEEYYHLLKAEQKQLIWFEKSAHNITASEPEKLQDILIEKVLGQQ